MATRADAPAPSSSAGLAAGQTLVLWDGQCGFCRRIVEWCEARDTGARLRFVPYQDAPRPPMDAALEAACQRAVHAITPEGERLRAGRACLHVLRLLGWRWLPALGALPPFSWLVELAYWIVANNRYAASRILFRKASGGERIQ